MNGGDGERSSSEAQRERERVGRENIAGPNRKTGGGKRQQGRSGSRLIRERGNVQKQFSAADGEQGPELSGGDTLTSA